MGLPQNRRTKRLVDRRSIKDGGEEAPERGGERKQIGKNAKGKGHLPRDEVLHIRSKEHRSSVRTGRGREKSEHRKEKAATARRRLPKA